MAGDSACRRPRGDEIDTLFAGITAFAVLAVIGGLLVHRTLGMYMEGEINGGQCVLMIGVYLAIIGAVVVLRPLNLRLALLLLLLLVAVVQPSMRDRFLVQMENRRIDREMLQEYYEAIQSDPKNLAARAKFAEVLHKLGRIDEAIEHLDYVVRLMPGDVEERRKLEYWTRERDEKLPRQQRCRTCGAVNDRQSTRCRECEASLRGWRSPMSEAAGISWLTWFTAAAMVAVLLVPAGLPLRTRIALAVTAVPIAVVLSLLLKTGRAGGSKDR